MRRLIPVLCVCVGVIVGSSCTDTGGGYGVSGIGPLSLQSEMDDLQFKMRRLESKMAALEQAVGGNPLTKDLSSQVEFLQSDVKILNRTSDFLMAQIQQINHRVTDMDMRIPRRPTESGG